MNIGISADLFLDISSLCFLHQSSVVQSVFTTIVRTAEWEGPCIIIIMSSANVTISRFGVMFSRTSRPLIIMFHSVGP